MNYEIIKIDDRTWRIEDMGVRFFLLIGDKEALLVDSGMTVNNAKEIAESLTDLPIKLLNTHADPDHIGSNHEFDEAYMNPAELYNYYKLHGRKEKIVPVWDGDVIDLGNRPLQVITLPGHTQGSIAVLDVKNRFLISGDSIQDGAIFMFGPHREIHAYQYSLEKLERFAGQFDEIYPSHGSFPVKPSLIGELHSAVNRLMAGEFAAEEETMHGTPIKKYDVGAAVFLLDA